MARYIVRYESTEYYQKTYEADSFDEATSMYFADGSLFDSSPYGSNTELIEIVDEEGDYG